MIERWLGDSSGIYDLLNANSIVSTRGEKRERAIQQCFPVIHAASIPNGILAVKGNWNIGLICQLLRAR